jgi:undecaprenyl-diphosphatase
VNARARRLSAREHALCVAANRWCTRTAVRTFFRAVSRLGDGIFWYGLMAALVVFDGWRGLAVSAQLAATGVVALTLYRKLKRWTKRPRPCAADRRIRAWIAPLDEFSFPSGHTLHAVSFTIVAVAHYPALAVVLVPFAVCVALSRVVLGLHYPSDVVAATGVGALLAGVSMWLFRFVVLGP